jgi:ABC-2 type transport system ATP-binding protein
MILGIREPDGGKVEYWCEDPRSQIGVQLQSTPFFPGLSAAENLRLFAAFYGIKLSSQEISMLLEKCGLKGMAKVNATRLSGGQQKRLAIAIALVHQPKLIFLDEPTAALDPRARQEIRELIGSLAEQGTAVVFTSHDMEEVEKLADRVILIAQGEIKASGTPEELYEKYKVNNLEELYLNITK